MVEMFNVLSSEKLKNIIQIPFRRCNEYSESIAYKGNVRYSEEETDELMHRALLQMVVTRDVRGVLVLRETSTSLSVLTLTPPSKPVTKEDFKGALILCYDVAASRQILSSTKVDSAAFQHFEEVMPIQKKIISFVEEEACNISIILVRPEVTEFYCHLLADRHLVAFANLM